MAEAVPADRRRERWPVWALGALVLITCALASATPGVPVFLLPSQLPAPDSSGVTPNDPGLTGWDYWVDPRESSSDLTGDAAVLASALFLAALMIGILMVIRMVAIRRRTRREARTAPAAPSQITFDRVLAVGATEQAVAEALDLLDAGTDTVTVDDVIIGCWRSVLAAGADAGLPRGDSETSTEYVDRLAAALQVDPAAPRTLATLYREARFSEHRLGDTDRDAARDALGLLRSDLARLRALR